MIKTLNKLDIEGTYLSIIKTIYTKPTANFTPNSEEVKNFYSKIRNKTKMPL